MLRSFLVGLTLSGCAVTQQTAPPEPDVPVVVARPEVRVRVDPPLVASDGFVLLDPKAIVRDAPRAEARGSDIHYAYLTNYPYTYGKPHPARVVGRSGAFYAIASGQGPGHCHPHRGLFPQFEITVFVHESEVVETVTRRVELSFSDGTSLQLAPGVALGAIRPSGLRTVYADPLEILVRLPSEAVGRVYRPVDLPSDLPAVDGEIVRCNDDRCRLRLGEGSARIATEYLEVATLERRGASAMVGLAAPCAALRARVDSESVRSLPENRTGQGMGSGCGGFTLQDFVAPPDAAVFWPDGRLAGHVGSGPVRMHRHHSRVVGRRRCFKRHATEGYTCGSDGKYLEVCVDESKLTTIERHDALERARD